MTLRVVPDSAVNVTLDEDQRPVLLVGGEPVSGDESIECDAATLAALLAAFRAATIIANSPVPVAALPSPYRN
jgi:hypothetical protein